MSSSAGAMGAAGQALDLRQQRRLWTVLIFLLWHAIFVEHSIVPKISEPHYPVQL